MTPRRLLLLDVIGALVTSVTIGLLFATNVVPTGMPVWILIGLSLAAACLCATGLAGYIRAVDIAATLRRLATLNAIYCIASGLLWWLSFDGLTFWGRLYFPVEIVIVLALAATELRVASGHGPGG